MRFLIQFKNKFCLPKVPILFNWKIMHVRIVQTLLTKTFSKRLSRDWDDLWGHETRILWNMYGMFYSGRCNSQIESIQYQWAWRCFVGRIRWHLQKDHPSSNPSFTKQSQTVNQARGSHTTYWQLLNQLPLLKFMIYNIPLNEKLPYISGHP